MEKVKSLYKKTAVNSFGNLIPIGSEGQYIDMLSGLDNEQELKLGGNHTTSISINNNVTTITEDYKKADNTTIVYKVITTIENINTGTEIISSLYSVDGQVQFLIKTKTITIPKEVSGEPIVINEILEDPEEVNP